MKKIFVTIVICILLVGGVYLYTTTPEINSIFATTPQYLEEDFKINELQLKDSTYFYNNLTSSQKQIYTSIAKSVKNLEKKADVSDYSEENNFNDDVNIAMEAFLADHPEVFYINPKYEISNVTFLIFKSRYVNLSYNIADKIELDLKISEIKTKIENMTKDIESKSDFEKEYIIHDRLGKTVQYDYTKELPAMSHTAYGALMLDKAVCDGMTKAMQLLLDKVNITSYFATGTTETGPHAWNIVKLDNDYYNLDLTSDKSVKKGEDLNSDVVIHSYFNITDSKIKKTHTVSDKYILPKCNAEEYEYYNQKDYVISKYDNFNFELKRIKNASKQKDAIEFKVIDVANIEKKIAQVFVNENWIDNNSKNAGKLYYYNILDDTYVIVNK